MKRQITVFEFIRLLLAIVLCFILYIAGAIAGWWLVPEGDDSFGSVVFLIGCRFLPAFLSTLLATLIPSWRYKIIAATLMLSSLTLWGLWDVAGSIVGVWELAGSIVRLSATMTGALLAVYLWKQWRARWVQKARSAPQTLQPATKMPRTSPIVLGLSLISIPITFITIFTSAFLVLGYSIFLFLLLTEMDRVPTILIIAGIFAPIVAAWVSLRALIGIFRTTPPFQPAQSVALAQHPRLNAMIEEVCSAVATRKPDNVILHIKPTFFVTQQKLRTFDTVVKGRTLAIGMPFLPLLTPEELKAVLAHEFAHFSGRDTFYSVWVSPVYRGLEESIVRLQQTIAADGGGAKVVMNYLLIPSLISLIIFYEFFASIDMIISRSRELRADWIAASHFGSDSLIHALKKVVQYGGFFSEQQAQLTSTPTGDAAPGSTDDSAGHSPVHSQHHYRILAPIEPDTLQGYLDKAMNAEEKEFDSHPTLPTRIGNLPAPSGISDMSKGDMSNGESSNGEMGNGETIHEKAVDNETVDNESVNNETVDNETVDNENNNLALRQELSEEIAILVAFYENAMHELRKFLASYQHSTTS